MAEVLALSSKKDNNEAKMVDIFEIDGTTYQIPAKVRVNISLKYMRNIRKYGQEYAAGELLEDMLGEKAYEALMNYDDLTAEDLEAVMSAVQEVALGGLETTPGKS